VSDNSVGKTPVSGALGPMRGRAGPLRRNGRDLRAQIRARTSRLQPPWCRRDCESELKTEIPDYCAGARLPLTAAAILSCPMNSNRFPANNLLAATVIGAVIATALAGCASGASESAGSASAPPPTATAANDAPLTVAQKDILGVWEGTTLAYCGVMTIRNRCNAEQVVSITLVQGENSRIRGFYTCSYGNLNCYNMNTTGNVVNAKVNGSQVSMIVMMPDGTSCRFNGRNHSGDVIGGYSCSGGGGSFEQGIWRARHSY
jgi:hypothetical protein